MGVTESDLGMSCTVQDRLITYLFVELDESWLKLSLDVLSCEVVGELVVRVRLASISLRGTVVSLSSIGHVLHGSRLVLDVLDSTKSHMRYFFVGSDSRVVRGGVPRQLREV